MVRLGALSPTVGGYGPPGTRVPAVIAHRWEARLASASTELPGDTDVPGMRHVICDGRWSCPALGGGFSASFHCLVARLPSSFELTMVVVIITLVMLSCCYLLQLGI